jgi:parvulin-like peptidyl-prolyl isomerase
VKQLAKKNGVSVSRADVNDEIALLRAQNRLGSSDQVFEDVLREFWDWSVEDFRRELETQILAQKVVSKLDTETHARAESRLAQIKGGADFAQVAKEASDDISTKANGGDYGIPIDRSTREIPPQALDALLKLQPGQVSDIIETPTGLEIVKVLDTNGGKLHAAHIVFKFQDIQKYLKPLKQEHKPSRYLRV